jgi:hypothetical protein
MTWREYAGIDCDGTRLIRLHRVQVRVEDSLAPLIDTTMAHVEAAVEIAFAD